MSFTVTVASVMTLIATSSQLSFRGVKVFSLRPGVFNECLPIVYLPLRRRVVRSPEKGARDDPRHARALPRTDEEVTPTPHHK